MLELNPQDLGSNWLKKGGRQKQLTIIVTLLDSREEMEKFSKNTEEPPQCSRQADHSPKANTHRAPTRTPPPTLSWVLARVLTWASFISSAARPPAPPHCQSTIQELQGDLPGQGTGASAIYVVFLRSIWF